MANRFHGRGNLGSVPEVKHVEVDGQRRPVANMRVYFDRQVPDGEGDFQDRGGFWLTVSLWDRKAEAAAKVLTKGARVAVSGTLVEHTWTDKESGEQRSRLELHADHVDLDLGRVERIELRNREDGGQDDA